MKQNKMTLKINGRAVICHTIEAMMDYVSVIYLITGHFHEELIAAVAPYNKVRVIRNSQYEKGMFSSIQTGALSLSDDFFLVPGDMPFIQKKTYEILLTGHKEARIPTIYSQKGHPVFLSKSLLLPLRSEPEDSNMQQFLAKQDCELVETNDEGILLDIDSPQEYQHLKQLMERKEGHYED
jgi:molybdenum cofactor cytidylyltransferase